MPLLYIIECSHFISTYRNGSSFHQSIWQVSTQHTVTHLCVVMLNKKGDLGVLSSPPRLVDWWWDYLYIIKVQVYQIPTWVSVENPPHENVETLDRKYFCNLSTYGKWEVTIAYTSQSSKLLLAICRHATGFNLCSAFLLNPQCGIFIFSRPPESNWIVVTISM